MAHPAAGKRLITLFGGAAIHVDGAPIGGRATHRHPLALIALLVTNGGRPVTRDKLIALLWPERDGDSARNLLKVNVHELRKELGDGAIRSTGDQLSADSSALSCDVVDFQAAIARGDDETAVGLYTGPFLDGFFIKDSSEFEQWVDQERQRFASVYGAALDRLAAAAEARVDHEAAVRWRRAHATHDPYHADVAHRLVKTLAAAGDRAGAIQFAESFVERRKRHLDISDDHDIVTLARRLKSAYTPTAVTPPTATAALPSAPIATSPGPSPASRGQALAARDDRRVWVAIAAIAIIGGAFLASKRMSRAPTEALANDLVAVAPFHVIGGDSTMQSSFSELLAGRMNGTVIAGAPSLTEALDLARKAHAGRLLTGDIATASDSTAVAARFYDVTSGKLIAGARADISRGSTLASVADRLTIEVLARAGGEPEDRIAGLVNRPAEAARRYLSAQNAYRSARYALAETLYARALDADTTFGAAGLGLAMANSWTVISERYGIGRDAALKHLAGMSPRDRLFAAAFFGPDPALGAPQPAPVYLSRWEDLVEKYPDWTEAWYQLGDRYYHYGRLSGLADASERAQHSFEKALAQDSLFAAPLHHLVELYAARGDRTNLRTAADRYFAANPGVSRDRSAIGWEAATALGDSKWLARVRANFDSMPREELARIVWVTDLNGWPDADGGHAASLADRKAGTASEHEKASIVSFALNANRGNIQEARVAAAALGAQYPDRPIGALWDLYLAMFVTGDTALASDAAKRLTDFARSPISTDHIRRDQQHLAACMLGYLSATRREMAAARAIYDRVSSDLRGEDNNFAKRNASVCLAMTAATISTNSGAPDARAKVAKLDTILLRERVPPHAILEGATIVAARLHALLGDTAAALVAARRREHLTGDPLFLSTQLREEARYARAVRDTAGSTRAETHLKALRP
jgi:DNA-binding SARP family transcriptional activator